MSGVLDRMAQRSRGLLQVVKPVMAPRYAPVGGEPRRPGMELETVAETEAAVPVLAQEGRARIGALSRYDGEADQPMGEHEGAAGPERSAEGPEKTAHAREAVRRAGPAMVQSGVSRRPSVKLDAQVEAARNGDVARSREFEASARSVQEESRNEPAREMARPGPTGLRRKSTKTGPAIERSEESGVEGAFPEQTPEWRAEMGLNSDFSMRNRMVAESPQRVDRRVAPKVERQVAPQAEEKTEIHISIGSVELRAPRVEPRPQAAPFRPRVTLDEFLRRKPETRA